MELLPYETRKRKAERDINPRSSKKTYSSHVVANPTGYSLMDTSSGYRSGYSRYRSSSRRSRYYRKYPYRNLSRYRGPYAKISSYMPELKTRDLDYPPFPVSFGDMNGTIEHNGMTTNIYTHYSGTNSQSAFFLLNGMALGTSSEQRVGRVIKCKSLWLRCHWSTVDPSVAAVPQNPIHIRTIVVWDRNPNGVSAPLAASLIYKTVIHVGNPYFMPRSPRNLDNRDRFTVLLDTDDTINPNGDSTRFYEKYLKLDRVPRTTFNSGGGATLADVSSGALYLILVSDQRDATATTAVYRPWVAFNSRVRYYDC